MLIATALPASHFDTLVTLFLMLVAAKVMAELFESLRQPAVVGEIVAGVLIGPSVLALAAPSEITAVLAEIGVIFLLFGVGLETRPHDIFRVGRRALTVAVAGVALPFIAGWLLMLAWGASSVEALFIGTAMVATSVGITARVLGQMGLLDASTSRIILGAAIIDDILGLIILAVVSSVAAGRINYVEIAATVGAAIGFTILVAFVGAPAVTRIAPWIEALRSDNSLFAFGLVLCLGLSAAAVYIGVAAIIGAFLAGMALAEATEDRPAMRLQMSGVTEFLVPFFLVNIGMQLKLAAFRDPSIVVLTLAITFIAIATKLIGGGAGVLGLGWRQAAQVGVGMVPRGEVGIVVAQIGLGMGVIHDELYAAVLAMAVLTTLVAPPALRILFSGGSDRIDDSGTI